MRGLKRETLYESKCEVVFWVPCTLHFPFTLYYCHLYFAFHLQSVCFYLSLPSIRSFHHFHLMAIPLITNESFCSISISSHFCYNRRNFSLSSLSTHLDYSTNSFKQVWTPVAKSTRLVLLPWPFTTVHYILANVTLLNNFLLE